MKPETTAPTAQLNVDLIHTPEALRQFSALLDRSFPVPEGGHYLDDFPIWDERCKLSGNDLTKIGVFNKGVLVSATAARIAMMRTTFGEMPVALIGAVVTDDAFRSRGLASETVTLAVEWAQKRGAAVCLLWGSEHALYQRLGFELAGTQVRVPLKELALPTQIDIEITQDWSEGIFLSLATRPFGLKISQKDHPWLSAHRNVKWYYAGDADKPRAYAGIGRGIDLPEMVHEWGGEPDALCQLLRQIQKGHPDASLLGMPKLLNQYQFMFQESQKEYLCMARILAPELLGSLKEKWDVLPLWVWGLDSA